jgi:hypothetical protein
VVSAVAFVVVVIIWAATMLSGKGVGSASEEPERSSRGPTSWRRRQPPVKVEGLDEYLNSLDTEPGEATQGNSPAQPKAEAPAAPAAKGDAWIKASEAPAKRGEVSVRITSAEIGFHQLESRSAPGAPPQREDCLTLSLEIRNESETRSRSYRSWNDLGPRVSMVDDLQTPYPVIRLPSDKRPASQGAAGGGEGSFRPREVIEDMLVFPKPADGVKMLRLELPADAFGERGVLRFEIPTSMVVDLTTRPDEPWRPERGAGANPSDESPADWKAKQAGEGNEGRSQGEENRVGRRIKDDPFDLPPISDEEGRND